MGNYNVNNNSTQGNSYILGIKLYILVARSNLQKKSTDNIYFSQLI